MRRKIKVKTASRILKKWKGSNFQSLCQAFSLNKKIHNNANILQKFLMLSLSFGKEKKRQIVLENFNNPTHGISLTTLKELSNSLGVIFHTFSSLNSGCGDTVHLLVKKKNNLIELVRFASEQQACCLTIAATNILCHWMEKKNVELVKTEISQIERMLQGQIYQLNNCPQMEIFQDLPNFPHRIECVSLVLRGIKKIL